MKFEVYFFFSSVLYPSQRLYSEQSVVVWFFWEGCLPFTFSFYTSMKV